LTIRIGLIGAGIMGADHARTIVTGVGPDYLTEVVIANSAVHEINYRPLPAQAGVRVGDRVG
jgi:hypothetical protein